MSDTEKFICDAAFENWWSGLPHPRTKPSETYRQVGPDTLMSKWDAKAVWLACWEVNDEISQKRAQNKLHRAIDAADFSDIL